VKEYDICVPLFFNDGSPIDALELQTIQKRLLAQFGGLTSFPQPNDGFWTMGNVMYRDAIVVYRVLAADSEASRRFLTQLKADLKRELQQQEILIIERDVDTL